MLSHPNLLFFDFKASEYHKTTYRMVLLFLFPAWYFPNAIAFWVIFSQTTFPVCPITVLCRVMFTLSHMRKVKTLVLTDVAKIVNTKRPQIESGRDFKIKDAIWGGFNMTDASGKTQVKLCTNTIWTDSLSLFFVTSCHLPSSAFANKRELPFICKLFQFFHNLHLPILILFYVAYKKITEFVLQIYHNLHYCV